MKLETIIQSYEKKHQELVKFLLFSVHPVIFLSPNMTITNLNRSVKDTFKIKSNDYIGRSLSVFEELINTVFPKTEKILYTSNYVFKDYEVSIKLNDKLMKTFWDLFILSSFSENPQYILTMKFELSNNKNKKISCKSGEERIFETIEANILRELDYVDTQAHFYNSVLRNIINNHPGLANVKSASSFQYILSNTENANVLGLSDSHDMEGKRVNDFKHQLPLPFIEQIQESDKKVVTSASTLSKIDALPFFDASGFVKKLLVTKIPLLDRNGRMHSILTVSVDSEALKYPHLVRDLYERMYKNPKKGLLKFLRHYDLTERDIDYLFALIKHNSIKHVAKSLGVSPKTAEKAISKLNEKLGVNNKIQLVEKLQFHFYNL